MDVLIINYYEMKYCQLRAFTLIEVLLAWSLFVMVAMGLLYTQLTALRSLRIAYHHGLIIIKQHNKNERPEHYPVKPGIVT